MTNRVQVNQNLAPEVKKRLEELRIASQNQNTQISSRVAHINSILGEAESYATLRLLRWPNHVVCPRCHSSHVTLRAAPPNTHHANWREFYRCLNCEAKGQEADFDDLTNLEINHNTTTIRNWILCWYLSVFHCPTKLIANLLNLPPAVIAHIVSTMRHIDVEQRTQDQLRLELNLKLKKIDSPLQPELTTTAFAYEKMKEEGTAFTKDKEEIDISRQRIKEASDPRFTYIERLGKPTPV